MISPICLDRYEKQDVSVRRKKKIGYLPPLKLNNQVNGVLSSKKRGINSQLRVPLNLNRSVDSGTRRRSETLSDVSYRSTASSNTHKAKTKPLVVKPRVRPVLGEVNDRAVHPRVHIQNRYKESPYVMNFKGKNTRVSPNDTPETSPPGLNSKVTPRGLKALARLNQKK